MARSVDDVKAVPGQDGSGAIELRPRKATMLFAIEPP
jgi:hypothetical protein